MKLAENVSTLGPWLGNVSTSSRFLSRFKTFRRRPLFSSDLLAGGWDSDQVTPAWCAQHTTECYARRTDARHMDWYSAGEVALVSFFFEWGPLDGAIPECV